MPRVGNHDTEANAMRVLFIHNRYRQYGGEDAVAAAEANLLRGNGMNVFCLDAGNDVDPGVSITGTLALALHSHWSRASYRRVREICEEFRPDVAHVHNFWMRLTPAVHAACWDAGVPTVQTLHNFRLFCTNAQFQRSGYVCQDCLGKLPWRGVVRRCYRHSFFASAAVARMIVASRARGTWTEQVSAFIALSEHSRRLFIAGGIPEARIRFKPNFIEDSATASIPPSHSRQFLFIGRLSEEKGVACLLSGWAASGIGNRARLMIVGDGPDRAALEEQAIRLRLSGSVRFAGRVPPSEVFPLLGQARAVVMPSVFYECFPRTLVEAMCAGRPVIASNTGALDELVPADMGLHFEPLDTQGLGLALRDLYENPVLADQFGAAARAGYLARYTPERNFKMLREIYEFAMGHETERQDLPPVCQGVA
jgi:glycosyltransferase involved in cell wall biosynthesis